MSYMDQTVACKVCLKETSMIVTGVCQDCESAAAKRASIKAWNAKEDRKKAFAILESFANPRHATFDHTKAAFVLKALRDDPAANTSIKASTPAAHWSEAGQSDPHGNSYNCERAALCMGGYTDDELANGAFMNYDVRPSIESLLNGTGISPIAWMTAVKERIRWLSRALTQATQVVPTSKVWSDDELHKFCTDAAAKADLWAEAQDVEITKVQMDATFARELLVQMAGK